MEPISLAKRERLLYFLKDDKYALLFCLDLLYVAHVWDDLVDRDVERTAEEINGAFIKSLAHIPNNPFYQQWMPALLPMMHNALVSWLLSNELVKGSKDDKVTAFSIMHGVTNVIQFCILVKGGTDWAREVGVEFWQLFGVNETELYDCIGAETDV